MAGITALNKIRRQQAAFGGVMGRDGRRMYGGGSDMGQVAHSQAAGPGTGGYQGGPKGGMGDAGNKNNPSGDRYRSSRREFIQQVNHNRAIEAGKGGPKFKPYDGGSKPQNKNNPFKSVFDFGKNYIRNRAKGLYNIVPNNPERELQFLSSLNIWSCKIQ